MHLGKRHLGVWVAAASLFFLLIAFFPCFKGLYAAWQTEEYSHGFLIPFLAVLIGWHRLSERKPKIETTWAGPLVLLFGFFLLAFSKLSAFEPFSHYGFLISLVGTSLSFFGKNVTKVLAVSFVYLFFVLPLPRLIYVALSADMQLLSSTLGVWGLQSIGLPVHQEGNIVDLGEYQLQVVEACSGLRYLFPLMSFSFLVALIYNGALWKRAVVFLSAIPLTIGMNSLRIALIGVTVDLWGIEMADGVLHAFEGWAVFSLCVLMLFAETKLLSVLPRPRHKRLEPPQPDGLDFQYFSLPKLPASFPEIPLSRSASAASFLCFMGAILFASGAIDNRREIIPPRSTFMSFPSEISDWKGETKFLSPSEWAKLDSTDYFLGDYQKDGANINLYMVYYASQRIGSSIHSPSNCLPGSGWKVEEKGVVPVALRAQTIPITRTVIRKNNETLLVYYWFQGRGRILDEQYAAKWYLLVDSLALHRTDGALVRVTTPVGEMEKTENADRRLQEFLAEIAPRLDTFIPGR